MSVIFDPSPPPTDELYCPTCEKHYPQSEGETRRCPTDNTKLIQLVSSIDSLIGRELEGRYTIVERLGAGGMGTVYRADQHSMGREVAVKVLNSTLLHDPLAIKRFLREAKLASRLNHPSAVGVLDFGQTGDGMPFLVMELVDGRTLEAVFRAEGRLAPERICRIAIQVCDALDRARELKIVHRDLKPANIMLLSSGRDLVKVLDFGLAKSLSLDSTSNTSLSGDIFGTPAFMPPEIANGQECDHRSDIYSLGISLYFLAAGAMPFHGSSVHEWLYHHAETAAPIPVVVPEPLRTIILRMIAKRPDDRYGTAAEARSELEEALLQLRDRRTPVPTSRPVITSSPASPPRADAAPAESPMPVARAGRIGRTPPRPSDLKRLELGHTVVASSGPSNGNHALEPPIGLHSTPLAQFGAQVATTADPLRPARFRRYWPVVLTMAMMAAVSIAWVSRDEPRGREAPPRSGAMPPQLGTQTAPMAADVTRSEAAPPKRVTAPSASQLVAPVPTRGGAQPEGETTDGDDATALGSPQLKPKPASSATSSEGRQQGNKGSGSALRKGSNTVSNGTKSDLPF